MFFKMEFNEIKDTILQTIFPWKCVFCGEITDGIDVCDNCWSKVCWITEPYCGVCGQPFITTNRKFFSELSNTTDGKICTERFGINGEQFCTKSLDTINEQLCSDCRKFRPSFDEARSVFAYDRNTRLPILNFKNKDATYLSEVFANWMCRVGETILKDYDIIIPVPIHRKKLIKRFYNQSALLAKRIANKKHKVYLPLALEKIIPTRPQEGLTRDERLKNIRDSFKVNDKFLNELKGKKIVLIDDVMTTGATANECARILKKTAGVEKIAIITIAKVIKYQKLE